MDLLNTASGSRKSECKRKKPAESPLFGSSWLWTHPKDGISLSLSLSLKKKEESRRKMKMEEKKVETKAKNAGYPAVSTTFYDSGTSTCLAVAQHGMIVEPRIAVAQHGTLKKYGREGE